MTTKTYTSVKDLYSNYADEILAHKGETFTVTNTYTSCHYEFVDVVSENNVCFNIRADVFNDYFTAN